jgi:hypothetical protein
VNPRYGMLIAVWVSTITFASAVSPPAQAQQTREEIIRAALEEFDVDRAFAGLRAGVDPNLGPPDSLWAVGVMRLAEILWERDQTEEAATWLRWAIRLWPEMPVDSVALLYDIVAAHGRAKQFVGPASAADSATHTTWDRRSWVGAATPGADPRPASRQLRHNRHTSGVRQRPRDEGDPARRRHRAAVRAEPNSGSDRAASGARPPSPG